MTVVSIMRSAISRASSRELIAAIPRFSSVVAGFALALTLLASAGARAQTAAPLTLEATIRLDNIGGRIDHMAFDRGRQRLLVAALGNNTLEVIDARAGKRVGEITGLDEPQGVTWSERAQIIF